MADTLKPAMDEQAALLEQAGLTNATREEQKAYIASLNLYEERAKEFDVNYFEKDEFIGKPFTILDIKIRKGRAKDGGDDWALVLRDPKTGEEGVMTFDKNPNRDDVMANLGVAIRNYGTVPGQTLQELPQSDPTRSNALTIVPIAKWKSLDELEMERLQKKNAKRRRGR